MKTLLLGGVVLLSSACGESASTADSAADAVEQQSAQTGVIAPTPSTRVVTGTGTKKSVAVSSIGGSLRLDERTGAIYSIELRDGSAFLQGLALLRSAERGWYNNNIEDVPKTIRNPGVGASLGRHLALVTPKADAIWLDDTKKVSLADANVVLFEVTSGNLTQVGSLSIDSYLGPSVMDDARQRQALVQERLAELLRNSSAISALWSD